MTQNNTYIKRIRKKTQYYNPKNEADKPQLMSVVKKRTYRCSYCHEKGHTKINCLLKCYEREAIESLIIIQKFK
jgi:hypothetical protein